MFLLISCGNISRGSSQWWFDNDANIFSVIYSLNSLMANIQPGWPSSAASWFEWGPV